MRPHSSYPALIQRTRCARIAYSSKQQNTPHYPTHPGLITLLYAASASRIRIRYALATCEMRLEMMLSEINKIPAATSRYHHMDCRRS